MQSYVFIPARLASTRLPRKLLLCDTGKSVLQHTYEAALCAARPGGVCVAAEDDELAREVQRFGGQVVVTGAGFASGTDRVAAVAAKSEFEQIDVVVNLQADEPEIAGEAIDRVVQLLEEDTTSVMATLATPIVDKEMLRDPACVKVVFDERGRAIYFSRAAIPHVRDEVELLSDDDGPRYFQHIGLYAYRRDFLMKLATLPRGRMEQLEQLEQLRVLEAGFEIAVGVVNEPVCGIDTAEDYRRFVARQRAA